MLNLYGARFRFLVGPLAGTGGDVSEGPRWAYPLQLSVLSFATGHPSTVHLEDTDLIHSL